jgi:SPOR domain
MSSGWAVQLAAPKSETEAKSDAARLNAKYASAFNGEMIGVSKAQVNGATVYRLRIVGLSKSDAAALCAHVKVDGGPCFVAK